MSKMGLTLDANAIGVGSWGDHMLSVEGGVTGGVTLGVMVRGDEFAMGPQGGVAYSLMDGRENHTLGWYAGLRADFLTPLIGDCFWGVRIAGDYRGEQFILSELIEHGFDASLLFQFAWQNRTNHPVRQSAEESATLFAVGPWFAYFPESERAIAGIEVAVGFDPFIS